MLDDYAVHLMPEVRQTSWNRGYILVVIGWGITSFVQVNDTPLHTSLSQRIPKERVKTTSQEPVKENNYVIGNTVTLAGISV